jgi:peptidoglycan/xylan/chitin deacetylase (PgdA/CDA1 family)
MKINKNILLLMILIISSLTALIPTASYAQFTNFKEGVVSIEFDDGWTSAYENGLPIVEKYGFKSTQGVITNAYNNWSKSLYMSNPQLQDWLKRGHDLASHTTYHPDLTTLPRFQVHNELSSSKTSLMVNTGKRVDYFIAPYCAFNKREINISKYYYKAARGCFTGSNNTSTTIDKYNLDSFIIDKDTPTTEISNLINKARQEKTLLILVYHAVLPNPSESTHISIAKFEEQMKVIKNSNIKVLKTMEALNYLKVI